MTSYWIGLAFYYTDGQIAWRFPVTFQCVFTFAMSVQPLLDATSSADTRIGFSQCGSSAPPSLPGKSSVVYVRLQS